MDAKKLDFDHNHCVSLTTPSKIILIDKKLRLQTKKCEAKLFFDEATFVSVMYDKPEDP